MGWVEGREGGHINQVELDGAAKTVTPKHGLT